MSELSPFRVPLSPRNELPEFKFVGERIFLPDFVNVGKELPLDEIFLRVADWAKGNQRIDRAPGYGLGRLEEKGHGMHYRIVTFRRRNRHAHAVKVSFSLMEDSRLDLAQVSHYDQFPPHSSLSSTHFSLNCFRPKGQNFTGSSLKSFISALKFITRPKLLLISNY